MTTARQNKDVLTPLLTALRDFDVGHIHTELASTLASDAVIHMCHPFGDLTPDALFGSCFSPLIKAMPDVERRDTIIVSGTTPEGLDWVGCCGSYVGTFSAPFLGIPPTGHLAHMRFHEFYQINAGKITEVQAIWDIPELMMQAGAWPMAPSLGREWHVPGPITQDGLADHGDDDAHATRSRTLVLDMLTAMSRHPKEPVAAMELEKYWHPKMTWYGPAGIGTARGIAGFRNWHQIPFLNAMPDRGQYPDEISIHLFAQGDYVAVTGWPDMAQTLTGGGWLGLVPNGQKITLRSLDFWRIEAGQIRENWVLVDLLDVYRQLGVDVFARLAEFNKARNLAPLTLATGGH